MKWKFTDHHSVKNWLLNNFAPHKQNCKPNGLGNKLCWSWKIRETQGKLLADFSISTEKFNILVPLPNQKYSFKQLCVRWPIL